MQRQVIVTGIVPSYGRVGHSTADTEERKIVGPRVNKSGVLVMSDVVTTIHAMRSSIVATSASYKSEFRWSKKKLRNCSIEVVTHRNRKMC
ncbi:hypothetical protein TNCV_1549161 [Trichonephila clavipes]|nr:hypothetical protein TNCV_1549161 [Trichonephila clavipes]